MQANYLFSLRDQLRTFARERDWEQFHTPKNLACAISVEAAELLQHFQWDAPTTVGDISDGKRGAIGSELADVLIYIVRLADVLDIELRTAIEAKLVKNALRYPAHLAKGKSQKYSEL